MLGKEEGTSEVSGEAAKKKGRKEKRFVVVVIRVDADTRWRSYAMSDAGYLT